MYSVVQQLVFGQLEKGNHENLMRSNYWRYLRAVMAKWMLFSSAIKKQFLSYSVYLLFFTLLISTPSLHALLYKATSSVTNPFSFYTLANSVECHPTKKLFCVTYTQAHRVVIYSYENGIPEIRQILENPEANLSAPQHALFSLDGKHLYVINWSTRTIGIYSCEKNGKLSPKPVTLLSLDRYLTTHRPHGMAVSPNGKLLAVAFGAGGQYERAIGLFRLHKGKIKKATIFPSQNLIGTPKGITFTKDGKTLLVTFCDTNSIVVYAIAKTRLVEEQRVEGVETQLSRPEDIKISPCGKFCAVSNSGAHTIGFYSFDPSGNRINNPMPLFPLEEVKDSLLFPHGISFSPDGQFFFVTQFGSIRTTHDDDLDWSILPPPSDTQVHMYTHHE